MASARLMNTSTFVNIPEKFVKIINGKYLRKEIPFPTHNFEYENIFYLTFNEDVAGIRVTDWLNFIYGGGAKLLATNTVQALLDLGWRGTMPKGRTLLKIMESYELQRWYEWFYIDHIMNHGLVRQEDYEGCWDRDIIMGVILKYHLNNYPGEGHPIEYVPRDISESEWLRLEPEEEEMSMEDVMQTVKRGRGRPKGSKDKTPRKIAHRVIKPTTLTTRVKPGVKWHVSTDDIEKIRIDLMKCRTPMEIGREIDKSDQTIYNTMEANMFEGQRSLNKSIEGHANNVMRLIANGDTTWDRYVRVYAICEKALIRKVYKMNPDFIFKYHIAPTRDSIEYEYETLKHNLKHMATAFGVPAELIIQWLGQYNIAHIVAPMRKSITTARSEKDIAIVENSGGIEEKYLLGRDRAKFKKDLYR